MPRPRLRSPTKAGWGPEMSQTWSKGIKILVMVIWKDKSHLEHFVLGHSGDNARTMWRHGDASNCLAVR